MNKNIRLVLVFMVLPLFLWAQTNLVVKDGNLVLGNGYLVLENSNLVNNATVAGSSGTVKFSGNSPMDNSIGGTKQSSIPNLVINPTGHNIVLNQDLTVSNNINILSGLLDIQNADLWSSNTSTSSVTTTQDTYIKTSGTGVFKRLVQANSTSFPVGNSTKTPLMITHNEGQDLISVRVQDQVLERLSSGNAYTKGVVNKVWHISEEQIGGLDLDIQFSWNAGDELSDFDRTDSKFMAYGTLKKVKWDMIGSATVSTTSPYTSTLMGVTASGSFTIASAVCGTGEGGILMDTEAPSVTCEETLSVALNAQGKVTIEVSDILKTSSDNCTPNDELMYNLSQSEFDCQDVGTTVEVTLTVRDKSNNKSSCKTMVTVSDPNPGPQWGNCLDDQIKTVDLNKNTAYVEWDLLADLQPSGVCLTGGTVDLGLGGGVVQITDPNDKSFSSGNFPIGTTTVTYVVMGTNNRSATCSFDIKVVGDCYANAGTDKLDICGDAVILGATAPSTGTGTWSVVSGGGNPAFDDENNPSTMFSGSAGEIYILKWSLSCDESQTDEVTVSFNPDSDNDSIQDCVDICPNGDDTKNTDGDNSPDDCDCAPLTPDEDNVTVLGLPFLDGQIIDGHYYGQVKLSTVGAVSVNGDVEFIGGEMVELKPGFHAKAGAEFVARLGYCVEPEPTIPLAKEDIAATARINNTTPSNELGPLQFNIGPNPFKDVTNLHLDLPQSEELSIAIFDQAGRLVQVLLHRQKLDQGHHQFTLTDEKLNGGLFFVQLTTSSEKIVKKLVVIRDSGDFD